MRRWIFYNYGQLIDSILSLTSNSYVMSSTISLFISLDSSSRYDGMRYHGYYDVVSVRVLCYSLPRARKAFV
jgi:hypothetical protein